MSVLLYRFSIEVQYIRFIARLVTVASLGDDSKEGYIKVANSTDSVDFL
jgi:hypothetical protein